MSERKHGISRIKALFLSAVNAQTSGGVSGPPLPNGLGSLIDLICNDNAGLIMSLTDSGTKELAIAGPSGLNHYLASTRTYGLRY
jgi:hypothetical protein